MPTHPDKESKRTTDQKMVNETNLLENAFDYSDSKKNCFIDCKEILPIVVPSKNNTKDNKRLQDNSVASSNDCLPENEITEIVSKDQLSFTRNQPEQVRKMNDSQFCVCRRQNSK